MKATMKQRCFPQHLLWLTACFVLLFGLDTKQCSEFLEAFQELPLAGVRPQKAWGGEARPTGTRYYLLTVLPSTYCSAPPRSSLQQYSHPTPIEAVRFLPPWDRKWLFLSPSIETIYHCKQTLLKSFITVSQYLLFFKSLKSDSDWRSNVKSPC